MRILLYYVIFVKTQLISFYILCTLFELVKIENIFVLLKNYKIKLKIPLCVNLNNEKNKMFSNWNKLIVICSYSYNLYLIIRPTQYGSNYEPNPKIANWKWWTIRFDTMTTKMMKVLNQIQLWNKVRRYQFACWLHFQRNWPPLLLRISTIIIRMYW